MPNRDEAKSIGSKSQIGLMFPLIKCLSQSFEFSWFPRILDWSGMPYSEICPCVARIIIPAWDSGFALDANDASEKVKNLKSLGFMGLILMVTSWCFLAMWSALFAAVSVATVALLISDWRKLKELAKSGLVCTAAYCREPIKPRSRCRSLSVTGAFSSAFRSGDSEMGGMFLTYFDWDISMLLSVFWWRSIPMKVNVLAFFDPNGSLVSSLANLLVKGIISAVDSIVHMNTQCPS